MKTTLTDICDEALCELVLSYPVFANLIMRIGIKKVESPIRALAWTDGSCITLNKTLFEEFMEKPKVTAQDGTLIDRNITKHEMMFILCHELMHILNMSFDRERNVGLYRTMANAQKEYRRWNEATDYEINWMLSNDKSGYRTGIGRRPNWVLYEPKYADMSAEDIYLKLKKEDKSKDQNDGKGQNGDKSFGQGMSDDDMTSEESLRKQAEDNDLGWSLDVHLPIKDDQTKNSVIGHVQSAMRGSTSRSNNGGDLFDRMLGLSLRPEPFNWRKALSKYIKGFVKGNYSWNKPSRAGIANKLILPSTYKTPKLHVGVAVDTSGSVGDQELKTMLNYLFTILTQFSDYKVDVWCCSTEVHEETLTTFTPANKRELNRFKFNSTGGTYMKANLKFVKDHYKGTNKLDTLIIFSDFYDELDGDTTTTFDGNVIFMCIGHKDFVKPTKIKGDVFHYEDNIKNGG